MGRMPKVTCQNCGKEFSALRADCPFCGTRRVVGDTWATAAKAREAKKPRKEPEKPSSGWQLKLGLLLIAAAVVAVVLLLVSGKTGKLSISARPTPVPTMDVQQIPPRPTPTPSPTPKVDTVRVFYLNNEITAEAGGFTMHEGDAPLTISARAYPNEKFYNAEFSWRISDPSKAKLTPSEDTQSCEVRMLESAGGYVTITVSCFGAECSIPLYLWK